MSVNIAIANQKGGVGKSTTVVTLAHGLAQKDKNTLIVDCDPQGQCAVLLGLQQEPGLFNLLISEQKPDQIIRATGRRGLDIISGDKKTATAQVVLSAQRAPISYLRDALKPIQGKYDYVIFDTAPSVGDLMAAALWASDYVLIPSAVDFLSSDGVIKLTDTLRGIQQEHGWTGKLLGIQPTFYDEQTRESKAILDELNQKFKNGVLDVIHRATVMRECAAYGQTIFELDGGSRSAQEYKQLIKHVLQVTK